MKTFATAFFALFLSACMGAQSQAPQSLQGAPAPYWSYKMCKGCHDRLVEQHAESYHEKSFTNPAFQGQYFRELLPRVKSEPDLAKEARECIACHSPITYMTSGTYPERPEQVVPELSGVTCDFCHTVTGYKDPTPGNGSYVSEPGERKFGPFRHEYNWHHVYGPLQTTSEFCGICHNATNRHGLQIKSTYSEWRESRFARDGIECQSCHMNRKGYLVVGKAMYESGQAAHITPGQAPYRRKLYTHRFLGAHSRTQITAGGAIALRIELEESAGNEIIAHVVVDNKKTGHKMPSGSSDLRLLWLEVNVTMGDKTVSVPADSRGETDPYAVAGKDISDREMLGGDIPEGSRIYRSVFVDGGGRPTLSSYDAVAVAFDNRLNAAEVRQETYRFAVPHDTTGRVAVTARLQYLPYPSSFTRRFGLTKEEPYEIAAVRKVIMLK
ncbi:MAG: multiheme c-type cytochrome [Nitrospiraceae bacterium]|nr:multiheme c-type cytochrome [Nitrospiraceae bacterium]